MIRTMRRRIVERSNLLDAVALTLRYALFSHQSDAFSIVAYATQTQ